jgi:putative ABC transport system permease protein
MDRFEYTAGTAPQNTNEVAITKISANKLGVAIGDTVTVKTIDGEKEYIITAFFQSMSNQGDGIQIHPDERINYAQAMGCSGAMIRFNDDPTAEEVDRRIEKLKALYPDVQDIKTCAKMVEEYLMVVPAMDAVKVLVTVLTAILTALVTLLMERSFIAKEQGEIALLKAIGTRNGKIYAYHVLRFVFVAVIAVIISELIAMPLTKLCFDPIFKMMGMETGVKYMMNPVEMFLILPAVVLGTTTVSAFLTALYTRKIKSSDTANIE